MRSHDATPASLNLYVPHPESRLCTALARGSAIVGLPLNTGLIRIYYEGNVIGGAEPKPVSRQSHSGRRKDAPKLSGGLSHAGARGC